MTLLEKLSPYVPYRLKVIVGWGIVCSNEYYDDYLEGLAKNSAYFEGGDSEKLKHIKPVLRPLKDIEEYFLPKFGNPEFEDVTTFLDSDFLYRSDQIEIDEIHMVEYWTLPTGTFNLLVKHHFDVFEMIKKGEAIDINTLNN